MEKVQQTIRAPRGTELQTKGWVQEAALRMLMNNLDPKLLKTRRISCVWRNWPCSS